MGAVGQDVLQTAHLLQGRRRQTTQLPVTLLHEEQLQFQQFPMDLLATHGGRGGTQQTQSGTGLFFCLGGGAVFLEEVTLFQGPDYMGRGGVEGLSLGRGGVEGGSIGLGILVLLAEGVSEAGELVENDG